MPWKRLVSRGGRELDQSTVSAGLRLGWQTVWYAELDVTLAYPLFQVYSVEIICAVNRGKEWVTVVRGNVRKRARFRDRASAFGE